MKYYKSKIKISKLRINIKKTYSNKIICFCIQENFVNKYKISFYRHNKIHRENNKIAFYESEGSKKIIYYKLYGKLHRTNGPAILVINKLWINKMFYLHGKYYGVPFHFPNQKHWTKYIKLVAFK